MSVDVQKETCQYQAEVGQVLNLVINNLYSNKEIFLRELISNASDAADKLRFEALANSALFENDPELKITISIDKENNTIVISDNGIGMSRDDVVNNLGTIAKSGTKDFFSALSGDQKKDAQLIGQFGVGFYAAFIVADEVTVRTRHAGETSEHGVEWVSEGKGEYTIQNIEKTSRGTDIVLHIKEDAKEFLEDVRLRNLISHYSDHITLPIYMNKINFPTGEEKEETIVDELEQVNRATALWQRPKSEISDEEYGDLYKHVAHDFEDPLAWSHNRVEGKHEYTSLFYIPQRAPFDLWNREKQKGIKLYVKRVFIMDDAEQLMPMYLRFVKGIVDSSDLPLNISREILQNNSIIDSIRRGSVKKILSLLESMAKNDSEKYATFWKEFGQVLKEGPVEDFENREQIAKLLRFSSTASDSEAQTVSFDDYIGNMKDGQEVIYYVTADSFAAAKNSAHLEIFRKKGIEVLLLSDKIDEWLVSHMTEVQGKKLQSVTKGDLDLGGMDNDEEKALKDKQNDQFASVVKQMKEVLGDRVEDVRVTHRLTTSPSCVVVNEQGMDMQMQRMLKAAGQPVSYTKPLLEINPLHGLVQNLQSVSDDAQFADWTNVLFDQAVLAESGQLDDPAGFIQNINSLLGK